MTTDATFALLQGQTLMAEGKPTEAIEMLGQALAVNPTNARLVNALATALQMTGQNEESVAAFRKALQLAAPPLAWRLASNYLTGLQYATTGLEQIKHEAVFIGRQFGSESKGCPERESTHVRSLRIGFVSPDFCDHPVGLLFLPLLIFLDKTRFRPILYATRARDDSTALALKRFGAWHDVSGLSYDELLAKLREDRPDILVDMAGHTAGNSLPVFASRAAPLQISWLGYFSTTGVAAIDCVLMDALHVPVGHESQYTEEVLRMPHCRWCYNPVEFAPQVESPPCLKTGYVTFGSFNNTAKYNDDVFEIWAQVLLKVPHSRVILKWTTFADSAYAEHVRSRFAAKGISAERLELRSASFHRRVLEQYADIDIALDPFPFTGGYTSCEALWMGLPIITLRGDRAAARQTFALIATIEQPEWLETWVAHDVDDYVAKAIALASDPARLATIRTSLRSAMKASPLMNGRQFAKDFEGVILARWGRLIDSQKAR